MIPVIRIYLLYLQTVLIIAGFGVTIYRMRVSNTFTVNVIFCPLKANTRRLKNKSCNRNEPKQYTNAWQIIIEVSNSTKQHADNSAQKSCRPMTGNGSSFLLITQYKMLFINKSEATKRSNDRNINDKSSVQMARTVGVVFGLSSYLPQHNNMRSLEMTRRG